MSLWLPVFKPFIPFPSLLKTFPSRPLLLKKPSLTLPFLLLLVLLVSYTHLRMVALTLSGAWVAFF